MNTRVSSLGSARERDHDDPSLEVRDEEASLGKEREARRLLESLALRLVLAAQRRHEAALSRVGAHLARERHRRPQETSGIERDVRLRDALAPPAGHLERAQKASVAVEDRDAAVSVVGDVDASVPVDHESLWDGQLAGAFFLPPLGLLVPEAV